MKRKSLSAALSLIVCGVGVVLVFSCDGPSNSPPSIPSEPRPANHASGVPPDDPLKWNCSDPDGDTVTFFIGLGTENPPPLVAKGVARPFFDPRPFAIKPFTTYYWYVSAYDNAERAASPIWTFTTGDNYCHHMPLDVGNKWVYRTSERVQDDSGLTTASDGEETWEVTEFRENYENAGTYVVEASNSGNPVREFRLAPDGKSCYLYYGAWIRFMADDLETDYLSERGLLTNAPMTYIGNERVTVPAGSFPECKLLYRYYNVQGPFIDNTDEYWEYYAPDVGLVYYKYRWFHITWVFLIPFIEQGEVTHELTSYEVKKRPAIDSGGKSRGGAPSPISSPATFSPGGSPVR